MGKFTMAIDFGTWLRAERKKRGKTIYDIAALAEVSHVAVSDWERGKRNPRRENVELVAAALSGSEASEEEAARLLAEALTMAGFSSGQPEMISEPWDEDTLEVAHFFHGIADPRMRDRVKRIMKSAVEIFDEEPEDAGPSGNRTD